MQPWIHLIGVMLCCHAIAQAAPDIQERYPHVVAYNDFGSGASYSFLSEADGDWTHPPSAIPLSIYGADDPVRTIAYASDRLVLGYGGLNPEARYAVELTFLCESGTRRQSISVDGEVLQERLALPAQQALQQTYELQPAITRDGQIEFTIERLEGPNAVVAVARLRSDRSGSVKAPPMPEVDLALTVPMTWHSGSLRVSGVAQPVINLNGTWQFTNTPRGEFWGTDTAKQNWSPIKVPGGVMMQGFSVKYDQPLVYATTVDVPADFAGQRITLRFDGVHSVAKLWVDGRFVREHGSGFTRWEADITDLVTPGQQARLVVEVQDREISPYVEHSWYAKHPMGGILRKVDLVAEPVNRFTHLHVTTDLDENYTDATLKLDYAMELTRAAEIQLTLLDPHGEPVKLTQERLAVSKDTPSGRLELPIEQPAKWDAERPNLYTLRVAWFADGQTLGSFEQRIGFREVEVRGNKMFVNGDWIKLRGANRHDIHPTLGRMSTPEDDRRDAELAVEANMNFIRTSHYPPTQGFLEHCDELGLYVECEAAICFQNAARGGRRATHRRVLEQLQEMVGHHRNHPSVIIWSTGNESGYHRYVPESYNWIKANDPTRPVIWSWPGKTPKDVKCFDLLSLHYPNIHGHQREGRFASEGHSYDAMPVIFDEWAHVACYNTNELAADPAVRNFWGISLDKHWEGVFASEGGLGGAIWCFVDETFMVPPDVPGFEDWWGKVGRWEAPEARYQRATIGWGPWGVVDTWRRKKPEFWSTKKAYSPIRLRRTALEADQANGAITLPIHNRFNHTNLNEVTVNWRQGDLSGSQPGPNLPPRAQGELVLPAQTWDQAQPIVVEFRTAGRLLDRYELSWPSAAPTLPALQAGQVTLRETQDAIEFVGTDWRVRFDPQTGWLKEVSRAGQPLIGDGLRPRLLFKGDKKDGTDQWLIHDLATDWVLNKLERSVQRGIGRLNVVARSGDVAVELTTQIDASGSLHVSYNVSGLSERQIKELGFSFSVPDRYSELEWQSTSYWSSYPENHIGAASGRVALKNPRAVSYRQSPEQPWDRDVEDFFVLGRAAASYAKRLTNAARAAREQVETYRLSGPASALSVHSQANHACRLDVVADGQGLELQVLHYLDYPDLSWGNYMRQITASEARGAFVIRTGSTD